MVNPGLSFLHTEWLDSKRLPGPAQYDNVLNYLTQKYIDKRFRSGADG
jgi:hypothetical protein